MRERKGDWIRTYTGGKFWPLDPRANEIRIDDIAAALGKLCRYGGQCIRFYSVAEHSVLVAEQAPDWCKLTALLHDAPEGLGLVDIPRPVKGSLSQYRTAEQAVAYQVARRFDLMWPLPDVVKTIDNCICTDESEQNMSEPFVDCGPPLGVTLRFWPPAQATYEFTKAFYAYGGKP